MKLYDDLAGWYHLVTAPEEYTEEAAAYVDAITRFTRRPVATLLDIGAGGGCNVWQMKAKGWACTLTDLSPRILEASRRLNPECEHVVGDMRTMRLDRLFDAVLVHDSICYMTTEEDLARAALTAFVHCAPGGVVVFAPDHLKETFEGGTDHGGNDDPDAPRGARYLEWSHDPDPNDTTYVVDYAFLLRDGDRVEVVHDRHVEGLFPRSVWLAVLERAGFEVERGTRPVEEGFASEIFVAVRP